MFSSRFASYSAALTRSTPKAADRKSTRLNSSHSQISYAAFCLTKNNQELPLEGRPASSANHSVPASRLHQPHDALQSHALATDRTPHDNPDLLLHHRHGVAAEH